MYAILQARKLNEGAFGDETGLWTSLVYIVHVCDGELTSRSTNRMPDIGIFCTPDSHSAVTKSSVLAPKFMILVPYLHRIKSARHVLTYLLPLANYSLDCWQNWIITIRPGVESGSPDSCQFYQLYQVRTWKGKKKYNKQSVVWIQTFKNRAGLSWHNTTTFKERWRVFFCEIYCVCKFPHCSICIVNFELCVRKAHRFIFPLGP